MEFRLLGQFEVRDDQGGLVEVPGQRPRALLAVLLLEANRFVATDRLISAIWPQPPPSARDAVQFFVHKARTALRRFPGEGVKGSMLETVRGGYLLRIAPDRLDVNRFVKLAAQAREAATPEQAWDGYRSALALWHGQALADFSAEPFARPERVRLEALRLSCVEGQLRAGLALGRHVELVGELEALVAEHPTREGLWSLLMLGLYRCGRQAEALAAYQEVRKILLERLGADPGADLETLQRQILNHDPALDLSPEGPPQAVPAAPRDHRAETAPHPERSARPERPGQAPPPAQPQVREERRTVTVLVVRIPHDQAAAGQGDPEEARDRAAAAAGRIAAAVSSYGGVVQPAPTGQVLGVFGADRSREDDPERAVRAALDIRAALDAAGVGPMRAGVATGQAVVTLTQPSGQGAAEPPRVVGDVVLAASALEAGAPPGAVLVGAGTYRATRRAIDYRPGVGLGHAFGVEVWQAQEPSASAGVVADGQAPGPLVEREREQALLAGLLSRFLRDRRPQLLTLVGEAGVGKTRLVAELGRIVDQAPEMVTWREGHVAASGHGGMEALTEIVKAHAGILDTDPPATAHTKLAKAVRRAIPDPDQAGRVIGQVRLLLGPAAATVDPVPGRRDRELLAGWAQLLGALAAERPLVLVLEDLQWAEELLLDFVEGLVEQVEAAPLLVVATARPELLDRRPNWGGGQRNAATISLTPLTVEGTMRLLDELLRGERLAADTRAQLAAASGGNPLYVEEYARMLREPPRGALVPPSLPIPETVQQVIAARIDTLPPDDKRLLQDAAVVGEVVWAGALAAVTGWDRTRVQDGLRRLQRREFLRRVRVGAQAGEAEYAFRHVLICEVAYQQVLRAERIDRHRRVAGWLEATAPERAELLAHHYGQALELARSAGQDAGDLAERARSAFVAAGDHAAALGAHADAARHYAAALQLWPQGSPDRADVLFRLGVARLYGEHAGEAELLAARDAYLADDRPAGAAAVELQLGQLANLRGDARGTAEHLRRALDSGAGERDEAGEDLNGPLFSAIRLLLADRYQEAVTAALEVAERARESGQPGVEAAACGVAGQARIDAGDPCGAELMRKGIAAMDAHAHPTAGLARYGLAWALWWYGDLAGSQRAVDDALPAVEGTATARWLRIVRAGIDCAAGRWEQALCLAAELIDHDRGVQDHVSPFIRLVHARIRLGRGDLEGALADVDAALPAARGNPSPRQWQLALALRGQVLLASGDREGAAGCLAELLTAQRADPARARVLPEQAELMVELGEPADALPSGLVPSRWHEAALAFAGREFARAARLYSQIGSTVAVASIDRLPSG